MDSIAELRNAGIEVSDPRVGALMIGTFCGPDWCAPAVAPTVDRHLTAVRRDLDLPPAPRGASAAEQRATVDAIADFTAWAQSQDLRLGSAWSAGGEGHVAQGQVVELDPDGVLAAAEVASALAKHYRLAYRIKAGPDYWMLVYFTTDPAGSTLTAPPVDPLLHATPGAQDLAIEGFHAAVAGWQSGFDDSVPFLRKLARASQDRTPQVGAIHFGRGGKGGIRIGKGRTQHERNVGVEQRLAALERQFQKCNERLEVVNRQVRERIEAVQDGALTAEQLDRAIARLTALHEEAQAEASEALAALQEAQAGTESRVSDLESRIAALESARSTTSDTNSIAGLHSEAVGGLGDAVGGGMTRPRGGRPTAQTGRPGARPAGGGRAGGRLGRPRPPRPKTRPGLGPGGYTLPQTRPGLGQGGYTRPKTRPGLGQGRPGGYTRPTSPTSPFLPRRKPAGGGLHPRGGLKEWVRKRREQRAQPWLNPPGTYPIPLPYPDPGYGGGSYGGGSYDGGGGGGGWGAPGQDFSNYFDDGQDWDGDGQSDADAEWLDEEGDLDLEAFLATLSDEELDDLMEMLGDMDQSALARDASATYLSSLSHTYKGLPPGWRPGPTPHSFIKPDGTPHNFGGGDYNNGRPTVQGLPDCDDLVTTFDQMADLGAENEDDLDLDLALEDDFDEDDFDEDDDPWSPVPPPIDIPRPPSFASQMRWMEYPGS